MKAFFAFIAAICTISSFAQVGGTVSGVVRSPEEKSQQITAATVGLLRAKDSAAIKFTTSGKDGSYAFEKVPNGAYLLSVTAVGHNKSFSPRFEISAANPAFQVKPITLVSLPKALAGVTVTAQRALIEQKIDRTIVNVDASVTNLGTSALEVLEKSPGITVDNEGNISLKGKDGVLVMIDGRPTQLGGADLAAMLRSMSSSTMDQVEIMTNPPARYDAAGNAGIINIKTKKTLSTGYNGSINLSYGQGRTPKTSEGFNLNYKKGKVNIFSNASHSYRKNVGNLDIQRNIIDTNTNATERYFDQHNDKRSVGSSYNAKLGMDYAVSKKTTLGIVLNGASNPSTSNNFNTSDISTPSKVLENITKASVNNASAWKNFSTNLNFRTLLDGKGKELTSDFDYITYWSDNDQYMVNAYFDARGNVSRKADTLKGTLPQNIKIYSGRIDYVHPLKKDSKFEAGLKSSIVNTDNDANYDSIQYGQVAHDFRRSNHFIYEENINAAYANFSTPLSKKWSAQFGLRLENTNAKGRQLTTGKNFDRHYTQLFPTTYFQYKANDKHNFGINYGRRVRRPNYQSLNPFIRFIDRYTYSQGNPNLKPQLSNNIELTHTWKTLLTTTLNYTATTDIIDAVIEQKGEEAYQTPANIASLKQLGLSVTANTPINKWWTSNIYVNVYRNHYKGIVSNAPVSLAVTSVLMNATQQFKLDKTATFELNGRVRSPWLEGVIKAKAIGILGLGFSQQVLKNSGTLRLTVRDVLLSQRFRASARYSNV
ncbi:MAG TPA: TonB-dependent receptor, partial [Flavisolibacter sp.]|nr:TonB-dependent receptor [Flavisolibacter sp.]